jgi:hypothetical protein
MIPCIIPVIVMAWGSGSETYCRRSEVCPMVPVPLAEMVAIAEAVFLRFISRAAAAPAVAFHESFAGATAAAVVLLK